MTNPYCALCAELVDAVEQARQALEGWANYGQWVWPEIALEQAKRNTTEALALLNRARALLTQPEPEGPEGSYFTDGDYNREIHYAWELEDAEGEWQAGGSSNRLDDVRREGSHYLQTYSQDGPHKLIIQRHCVSTIEEVTND